MADKTGIEWTDATWNPIVGCSLVSPGCTNCYAMRQAARIERMTPGSHYVGTTQASKAGAVWTGKVMPAPDPILLQPLRWRRPRRIFVNSMGDLFHESVTDAQIDRVFAVMALAPQHTFQVLTKRSKRMRAYFADGLGRNAAWTQPFMTIAPAPWVAAAMQITRGFRGTTWGVPLPNVWLGVSAEDQARADERIPDLLATPAALRFVSAEPLLGPIDFEQAWHGDNALDSECWGDCAWCEKGHPPLYNCHRGRQTGSEIHKGRSGLDWVIVGGESGAGARPMHPDWARSLRDQCEAAGVPFFFKQWGEWVPQVGAVDGWMIDDDPEISRFDHRDWEGDRWGEPYRPMWCDEREDDTVSRIGKRRAGRLLDGREHKGMP